MGLTGTVAFLIDSMRRHAARVKKGFIMWRTLMSLVMVAGLLALLVLAGRPLFKMFKVDNQIQTHSAPTIQSIREAGDLIVLRVPVTDLREVSVDGYLGGQTVLLLIHGVVEIGVDLRAARYTRLDSGSCTAELELSQPRVITAYIDHERSRVHAITRHGAWVLALGDAATRRLLDEGLRGAQRDLFMFTPDDELLGRARLTCHRLLEGQFDAVGWRLIIKWE